VPQSFYLLDILSNSFHSAFFFLVKDIAFFIFLQKNQRFCYAERSVRTDLTAFEKLLGLRNPTQNPYKTTKTWGC
jgi:hypothetical protein